MRAGTRRLGIAAAAIVAAVLAWFAPPPADPALPDEPDRKRAGAARFSALPVREAIGEPLGEPFAARSPAAAVQAPAPAPAPVAPPNPYRVAGTLVQDGAARVFVAGGDRVYEAKVGLELDGAYRVAAIAPDHVVLVYLPLGRRDVLPFESSILVEAARAPPAAPGASAGPAAISSAPPGNAQLRWEGPQSVRAGATFNVALLVSTDREVRATPMQLRFEPELLEPLEVRAGKFFGQGSFSYRTNPDGTIFVGATGRGAAPGADAELVVVTFRTRRAGATAQVSVGALALQDAAGRALEHDAVTVFRTVIQ